MQKKPRYSLLVIRGDLRSSHGYANALRAHLQLLAPHFDRVLGVDLHFHEKVSHESFGYPVVSEQAADQEIAECGDKQAILLNYCSPDLFRRHPNAVNIGLFYWKPTVTVRI